MPVRKNPYSDTAVVGYFPASRLPWEIKFYRGNHFEYRARLDVPGGLPKVLHWVAAQEPVSEIRLSGAMPGAKAYG